MRTSRASIEARVSKLDARRAATDRQDGVYPYATNDGVRWRFVFRQSRILGVVQQPRQVRQPLLPALAVADVGLHHDRGDNLTALATYRGRAATNPQATAVRRGVEKLLVDDRLAGRERADRRPLLTLITSAVRVKDVDRPLEVCGPSRDRAAPSAPSHVRCCR